eukprot:Phypoly_transcript_00563.p1 GENE.Phypoly_transcript_00563~~Phypoly_transcript_00563.p1  ORF type:complete len:938 (+),score=108.79 Phypoly_transcript_00563:27-2816(+)
MALIKVIAAKGLSSTLPTLRAYCVLGVAHMTGEFVESTCVRSEISPGDGTAEAILELESPVKVRIEVWNEGEAKSDNFLRLVVLDTSELQTGTAEWIALQPRGKHDETFYGQICILVSSIDVKVMEPATIATTPSTCTHSVPSVPSVPSIPSTPSIPSIPSIPSVSSVPSGPPTTAILSSHSTPTTTSIPSRPSTPSTHIPTSWSKAPMASTPLADPPFTRASIYSAQPQIVSPRKNITLTNPSARSFTTTTAPSPTIPTTVLPTPMLPLSSFTPISPRHESLVSPRKKVYFADSPSPPSAVTTAPCNSLRSSQVYPKILARRSLQKGGDLNASGSFPPPSPDFSIPTISSLCSDPSPSPPARFCRSLDIPTLHIVSPRKNISLHASLGIQPIISHRITDLKSGSWSYSSSSFIPTPIALRNPNASFRRPEPSCIVHSSSQSLFAKKDSPSATNSTHLDSTDNYPTSKQPILLPSFASNPSTPKPTLLHQIPRSISPSQLAKNKISLSESIAWDFPIIEITEIERMREDHTNFAHQKCLTYVPNTSCLQVLDEFSYTATGYNHEQGKQYLMITGARGCGKSSLISHWWQTTKDTLGIPMFVHFIGSCPFASDFSSMIIRLFKEINLIIESKGGIALELPPESYIVEHISIFFCALAKYEQIIVIFEGINQLAPKYQSLWWLPTSLPPGVGIICTTIEFIPSTSFHENRFQMAEILPMEDDDKRTLILQLYGKPLMEEHIGQLCSHPCSANPLFIQTTLTELCTVSFYEIFQEQLDTLMKCVDLAELFQCVIRRLEETFSSELTCSVLLLIACSRYGILEIALQEITGAKPTCLFPLLSALKSFTIIRYGKLKFCHQYMENAVLTRYSTELLHQTRYSLAQYLIKCKFDEQIAFELPWLLTQIIQSPFCHDKEERCESILSRTRKKRNKK